MSLFLKMSAIFFLALISITRESLPCYAATGHSNSHEKVGLEENIQKVEKIVIFPLENLSGNFNAPKAIASLLEEEIKKRGFQIIPYQLLDSFLNKRRIRDTGIIDRITAIEVRRVLGADAILLGSIDIYTEEGSDIYAGLTLRFVEPRGCSIIWMDTLSYMGSDFTGILDFGAVKSIDKLSKIVISEITQGMPYEYEIKEGIESFYEIGKVHINPAISGGGKTAKLSARIISLNEKPPAWVRARVDEKMINMYRNGEFYHAEIISPSKDGLYPIDIAAFGYYGEVSYFYSAAEIKTDAKAPKATITTDKDILRGYTKKDYILFTVKVNEPVEKWEVKITDENSEYVRGGKWYGSIPRSLIWRGENDTGSQSDDGNYTFKLYTWDMAGNMGISEKKIRLDSTPPEVKVKFTSQENGGNIIFSFDYDKSEKIKKWNFMVYNDSAVLIKKMTGKGNISDKMKIPLPLAEDVEVAKPQTLIYHFNAVDMAGNKFETSGQNLFTAGKVEGKFAKIDESESGWSVSDF